MSPKTAPQTCHDIKIEPPWGLEFYPCMKDMGSTPLAALGTFLRQQLRVHGFQRPRGEEKVGAGWGERWNGKVREGGNADSRAPGAEII